MNDLNAQQIITCYVICIDHGNEQLINFFQLFNIKFVGAVEQRPELYDYNRPGYSRRDLVEKAWIEISQEVNLPGEHSNSIQQRSLLPVIIWLDFSELV